jgi:hypothetical protein
VPDGWKKPGSGKVENGEKDMAGVAVLIILVLLIDFFGQVHGAARIQDNVDSE